MNNSHSPKGESEMKAWYRKLSLPLAVLTTLSLLAFSFSFVDAADQAADGQKLSPNVTGGTGAVYSARPAVPVLTGGMYGTDSTSRIFRTTTEGWQVTSEGNKDRDLWLNTSLTDIDTVSVGNGCDSTATAIYTAPYGRLFLFIKCEQGSAAVATAGVITWARLGITLQSGYDAASDTNTAVPWMAVGNTVATDSLTVGSSTAGTAAVAHPWEYKVTIPSTAALATKWGQSFGAYVELVNPRGLPYWAPYTRIKIRLVETNLATTLTNPAIVKLHVRLIGRPF